MYSIDFWLLVKIPKNAEVILRSLFLEIPFKWIS